MRFRLLKEKTDPMAKQFHPFIVFLLFQFLIFTSIVNLVEASKDSDLIEFGNQALAAGKYEAAEGFFKRILNFSVSI